LSKGNDGDPPLVVLQVKCAKGIQYFKMTLVNELRLFAMHTSVQMFFKRPVLFCLVKRLPHRKEFRRKKQQTVY